MPSLIGKLMRLVIRHKEHGQSSSPAEAGPSTLALGGTSMSHAYGMGLTSSSTYSIRNQEQVTQGDGSLSIVSTKPPSYQLPLRFAMPVNADRESLPDNLALEILPKLVLQEIIGYLPISSRLCLRYTCRAFFKSLMVGTSDSLLGLHEFKGCPKEIRKQRTLLLARLEQDNFLPRISGLRENMQGKVSWPKTDQTAFTCSACGKRHMALAFTSDELSASPFQRCCTGSMHLLYLCAHATMTWYQFSTQIVDDRPYYGSTTPYLTLMNYARDSGLSPKDIVLRHPPYGVCSSWDGQRFAKERTCPNGNVFIRWNGNPVSLLSRWRIGLQHLRDHLASTEAATNHRYDEADLEYATALEKQHLKGNDKPQDNIADSAVKTKLATLIKYLEACEICLCSHINFSDSLFKKDFTQFVTSDFAPSCPKESYCSDCNAGYSAYVSAPEPILHIDIRRNIGMGESAMESIWIMATHEPKKGLAEDPRGCR